MRGRFLQNPQVTLNVLQFRSQQVSVLGNVANPGRYPLETTGMRLSEILSVAGGVNETGSNNVLLMTTRNGRPQRLEIDLVEMFSTGDLSKDVVLQAGDTIFVNKAPNYYVYGQVQRPGQYVLDRGMTVAQAVAKGGGLTLRGTDRGIRLHRRVGDRNIQVLEPKLDRSRSVARPDLRARKHLLIGLRPDPSRCRLSWPASWKRRLRAPFPFVPHIAGTRTFAVFSRRMASFVPRKKPNAKSVVDGSPGSVVRCRHRDQGPPGLVAAHPGSHRVWS